MGLQLFNPRTKVFETFTTPSEGTLPLAERLLLNILIEMQVQTQILSDATPGGDAPANIRTDIVSIP